MAANGGLMVLQNGSPKNTYKELWDRDLVKNAVDGKNPKLVVSFDGRVAGNHPDGMHGAVGEALGAIEF